MAIFVIILGQNRTKSALVLANETEGKKCRFIVWQIGLVLAQQAGDSSIGISKSLQKRSLHKKYCVNLTAQSFLACPYLGPGRKQ